MFCRLSAVLAALAVWVTSVGAGVPPSGQVDFGSFEGLADGQMVEVNLGPALLNIATKIAGKGDPEAAKLLGVLKSIRINVLGFTELNRVELTERFGLIRKQLNDGGWERIVIAQEKKQDVAVYTKMRGEEAVEGIVITVMDGKKQVVLINIVGDIRVDQLAAVAEKLNLEPLKELTGILGQRK